MATWRDVIGGVVSPVERAVVRLTCLLRQRVNPPLNEVTVELTECIFGITGRYDIIELSERCALRISVRIRLVPFQGSVTPEELEELKVFWEREIEQRWSDQYILERVGGDCECKAYRVIVNVDFVDEDEHHLVEVVGASIHTNAATWDVEDGPRTVSHEFGHLLGFPDEYPDERCPFREVSNDDSIMADGQTVRPRHYRPFADWISRLTCCEYEVS